MTKKLKQNIFFIGSFFVIMFLMYSFSHKYFIHDYETIESIHNENNIKDLIKNLNSEFKQIKAISNAYSRSDDAHDFLTNQNSDFIYRNFRHGVEYINSLNIDFLIYIDINNNVKFYETTGVVPRKKEFSSKLVRKYRDSKQLQTTFVDGENIFYILKNRVLKTDATGKTAGYLYIGRALSKELFSYINSTFKNVSLVNEEIDFSDGLIFYNNTNKIRLKTFTTNRKMTNYLEVTDYKDTYIATIKTENFRDYIVESKKAILLFNIIVAIALLVIFFVAYKYQSFLQNYTAKLEKSVQKRTEELERSNKELHSLAYKDFLTKIDNRRSFFLKIEKLLKDKFFRKNIVHVVMIDIDNFKQINDKYSHNIGDLVLKEFAGILERNISHNDLCARLGGEEFVIAFTDLKTKKVLKRVEKIRQETQDTRIEIDSDNYLNFTASFGISDNSKTNNIDKILHKADSFLYEVKKSGKNNIRYRDN